MPFPHVFKYEKIEKSTGVKDRVSMVHEAGHPIPRWLFPVVWMTLCVSPHCLGEV